MDGRHPTATDYDLASQRVGADHLQIAWNSPIWAERGWSPSDGVVVVVGVRATFAQEYTLLLTPTLASGSPLETIRRLEVGETLTVEVAAAADQSKNRTESLVFMYYNWHHSDFSIKYKMEIGNGSISYGKAGQLDRNQNAYTAVPVGAKNAIAAYNVTETNFVQIEASGSACYTCWYFINATIIHPERATFTLTASRASDGGQYREIAKEPEVRVTRARPGKRKFLLESMDNWEVEAKVTAGDVTIYIGLDPAKLNDNEIDNADLESALPYLWKASASAGTTTTIRVRQTDGNFHLATDYYVYMRSNSDTDPYLVLSLKQERSVAFVATNNDYTYTLTHPVFNIETITQKFTFRTDKEQVKFHVFQVPPGAADTPTYHKITLNINPLTDALYPMVFLKKVEHDDAKDTELSGLEFPSMVAADLSFGFNPFLSINHAPFQWSYSG